MELKKVLVVEDSELLHRMYDLILMRYRNSGGVVLHAYDGREGLSILAENPDTQLILLDINMPVMSGLEFLLHVKKEGVFLHIPVIIISTEGKEADTVRGLEAGARGYLTKPFQAADLHQLMERVLLRNSAVAGASGAAAARPGAGGRP